VIQDDKTIKEAKKLGADDYIVKSDSLIEDIKEKIATALFAKQNVVVEVKELSLFKPTMFKSGFVGENLTLERYSSLDEGDKILLQTMVWEKNGEWLNNKFEELNAGWVTIINGEVETFSATLDEYPKEPDVLKISKKRGKFPFIFVNNWFLAIEEGSANSSKN